MLYLPTYSREVEAIRSVVGVFFKTWHLVSCTRPGSFRVLKYTGLRFDIWFIIQRASWNKDCPGVANLPGQRPPALSAESTREALGLGQLVGFYPGGITCPGESGITDKHIACVAGTCGFSAPRAVTMIKTSRFPGNDELDRPAQAGSFQALFGHGLIPLSI